MTRLSQYACAALLACALPLNAKAAPYCAALADTGALPAKYQKKGPFLSDTASGWIIGHDQLTPNYSIADETRALWTRIADGFAAHGVELIVLSPPPRPLFAPSSVKAQIGSDLDALEQGFEAYIAGLQAAGLQAPNLTELTEAASQERPVYFARDTHWTPYGAHLAAQALARETGSAESDAPLVAFDDTYSEKGSLSAVVDAACGARPEPEIVVAPRYPAAPATDLLADTAAPGLALVGSSFSNRYQRDAYQVSAALSHAFGRDVLNASVSGGGMAGSMIAFLENGALQGGALDRIVWEVPYTTPLTDIGGLRHVLGLLEMGDAKPHTVHTVALEDAWVSVKQGFDASATRGLEVITPGVTAGRLQVELFAENGTRRKLTLRKSDRIASPDRTERWTLAFADLPEGTVTRFKLRLRGTRQPIRARVALLD